MTSTPNQPDPTPRNGSLDSIPDPLRGDLKRACRAEDGITPPSRVDDAVFAAASAHFAKPAAQTEAQTEVSPGVLGWIGRRPLRSAGLGGALLAASVLVVVLIVSPNQPSPSDRSLAMDAMMEPDSDESQTIASKEWLRSPATPPPASARSSEDLAARDMALESEMAESLMDMAPLRREGYISSQTSLQGDVNADGSVTIADALLLARLVEQAGGTLDDPRFDLLGNGSVSRADADAIARLVVRLAPAPDESPNTEGAS